MKRLLVALLMTLQPALAKGAVNASIENGNFAFTKPYLMSVSYTMSADDQSLFALAITSNDHDKDKNGLDISTALSVNCKTGRFSAAFGFYAEKPIETAQLIAGAFCYMHKKQWSHSFW